MKVCPECQKELDPSCFGKNKSKKDGLQNYCKACRAAQAKIKYFENISSYQKEYRDKNSDRLSEHAKKKYINNPEYYKNKAIQWKLANPERKKELDRLWKQNNRDRNNKNYLNWCNNNRGRRREIVRRYDALHKEESRLRANRRRAKKLSNGFLPYTVDQLSDKILMWKNKCYLCGKELAGKLHFDHVKPIAKGGMDILSNIRPTHAVCNQSKGSKWIGSGDLTDLRNTVRLSIDKNKSTT